MYLEFVEIASLAKYESGAWDVNEPKTQAGGTLSRSTLAFGAIDRKKDRTKKNFFGQTLVLSKNRNSISDNFEYWVALIYRTRCLITDQREH